MTNNLKTKKFKQISLRSYMLGIAVLWSLLIALSLGWSLKSERSITLEGARIEARTAFEKDVIYRRWNAEHGEIYAPVTEATPPNPYIDVPERDITTLLGKKLTQINPAYMTRQAHELAKKTSGVKGHITSLNPIRPANAPDNWETRALKAFQTGVKEVSSVEEIKGENYMHLMQPLLTEKTCLKCHAKQGYKLGDIRGGLSVSIPLAARMAIERSHILTLIAGHGLLWVAGLFGIGFGMRRLNQQIHERIEAEKSLRESEERFITAFESAALGMVLVSPDGRYLKVNSYFCQMLGYTEKELLTKVFNDVTHPDDYHIGMEILRQVVEGTISFGWAEKRYLRKDGRIVWVMLSTSPVLDPMDKPMYLVSHIQNITERKQAEETFQREKLLSDSIIDNMPAGIAFLDNDFVLRKCNPAYTELIRIYTPYSPEQAIGMSYFDYVPGSRNQVEEWFQKVKDSGQGETRYGFKLVIERDGQEEATYWDTSVAPVLEPSGNIQGILILTQDVTERHRAEKMARDSEYYYRSLIHSMHEDILVIAPDYRIIDVNNSFLVTLKAKREDVIGRHCFDVSHGYNEPCTMYGENCLLHGVFDTGEPQNCRHIHQTVDGSRVWVDILFSPMKDEKGKVTHVIETMRDVTNLIKVEEKLIKSEEKYRLLVENANDAIFIVQDKVIKFPNPKTEELTGYSAEELARIPFVNLIHPDDREMVFDRHERRLEGEEIPSTYSFRILNRAGIELWIQLNTVLIEWELRPATLNFIRNITQQKKMEDQFQQAQKMEAIGTLAGGIAHDFNNLLMGIQGRASLMLMDTTTTNSHYEHLEGIEDYVKSAADLTNQLLAFARGGKYEVKPTNINELIKKENRMFGRTKKEITIRGKYEKDLWAAEVDQGQIEQVLLNLYVNAWQSMPGGGNLYIQTENVALDENYPTPFEVKPGKYVKISVTDTGVGMDETTQQRIFEPFFTTKEMGRGTGLGLASVYGIIKNHEGFINVYSEKGEGTTFNIYLPAAEAKGIEQRAKSEDKDKIARGTETVLLVDDENVIIYTVELLLKEMGYKTLIARSGKETVKIYKKNKDKIDVVILDMIMPDMGGGETYDRLKEINPDIKVLLSSGYSLNDKATMILERGCNGFIQKPYRSKELSQKIRKILDKD